MTEGSFALRRFWATFQNPDTEHRFHQETAGPRARGGAIVALLTAAVYAQTVFHPVSAGPTLDVEMALSRLVLLGLAVGLWWAARRPQPSRATAALQGIFMGALVLQACAERAFFGAADPLPGGVMTAAVLLLTIAHNGLPLSMRGKMLIDLLVAALVGLVMWSQGEAGFQIFLGVQVTAFLGAASLIASSNRNAERRQLWRATHQLGAQMVKVEEQLEEKIAKSDVLEQEANTDPLTGAHNRRAALAACRSWFESGDPVSVLLVDVDHFKTVNDTHGHAAGDAALQELVTWMASSCRGDDIVCRWGGDELLILAQDPSGQVGREIADRLVARVREGSVSIDGELFAITVSVGVARGATRLGEVIADADAALYLVKKHGRDGWLHHDDVGVTGGGGAPGQTSAA